jgi:hypothetical protein
VGLFALAILAAVLGALRGLWRPEVAAAVAGLVTLIDLTVVDRRLMAPVLGEPRFATAASERDDVIDYLLEQKGQGEFRIFPVQDFQSNRYAGFAIASLGGYHAAKPKRYQTFLDADSQRAVSSAVALRLLNVRYILYPGLLPPNMGLTEAFRGTAQIVYRNPSALPRATLVPAYRVANEEAQLAIFRDPTHDPGQVTLVSEDPGIRPVPGGTATIRNYDLNRVVVETDAPGPSLLRLADLAFPGWEVTVDGRTAKSLTADFLCRAVALPAGRHTVVWQFRDPALRTGLVLSGLALVAILGLYFAPRLMRRKAAPPARAVAEPGSP